MSEEIKTNGEKLKKGRKYIALQEGLIFGVLFIIACVIKKELVALAPFAMIVEGLVVSYFGANAVKGLKK